MTGDWHRSWSRAWRGLGALGDGEPLRQALLAAWAEPQRRYHTQQHLAECLDLFETVQALAPHPAEVEMALWFHDAVYDVHRSDNEARSARWACEALAAAGAEPGAVARIEALVMATCHDAAPALPDEQVLVDIDLAILGAERPRFDEYEQQIRAEYGFVPGWLFRRKRRAILRSFVDRAHIFSTPHFRATLEPRARANLARAIEGGPA